MGSSLRSDEGGGEKDARVGEIPGLVESVGRRKKKESALYMKSKRDSSTTQADAFAGSEREEKASARSVRNDSWGWRRTET